MGYPRLMNCQYQPNGVANIVIANNVYTSGLFDIWWERQYKNFYRTNFIMIKPIYDCITTNNNYFSNL